MQILYLANIWVVLIVFYAMHCITYYHLKCSQLSMFCTHKEKNVHNHLKSSQLSMFCKHNEKMFNHLKFSPFCQCFVHITKKIVHNHLKCSQLSVFCTLKEKNVHNDLKCSQSSKMFTIVNVLYT